MEFNNERTELMILVTGFEGFIGRNLVDYLTKKGEICIGIDRVHGDVFEQLDSVNWKDISMIYHQGAISSTTEQDVDLIYQMNVRFSLKLFALAALHDIPVHYASSGSVYGNSKEYAYNPLNYYAMSKMTVDMWVKENLSAFRKPIVGFRYFNVYGANEAKDDLSTSPIYRFSEHAKEHGVHEYDFKADRNETSRVSLYRKLAQKSGGGERSTNDKSYASFRIKIPKDS
jgi:ADP-L-glycero-D-manno-heptose 6-epimerase